MGQSRGPVCLLVPGCGVGAGTAQFTFNLDNLMVCPPEDVADVVKGCAPVRRG